LEQYFKIFNAVRKIDPKIVLKASASQFFLFRKEFKRCCNRMTTDKANKILNINLPTGMALF
jgi:hypothetical protein